MALINIDFPPGIFKNGTPLKRAKRWADGNLVRYHDDAWRPLGGWQRRQNTSGSDISALISDNTLEAIRDIYPWRDLTQTQHCVLGSNLALYHMSTTGTITDVTYAGYAATNSSKNASVTAGYGQNPYGVGDYGSANNLVGARPTPPNRWYFANFGELLIHGSRNNAGMYSLDPNTLLTSAVTNAPSDVQDICVPDSRQIFAIGGGAQPRRVQTTDVESTTDWTPVASNQSIDRTLAGQGRLLRCLNVLEEVIILGEQDAHAAHYIGPPYVWAIDAVGTNCGLIAAEAVVATDKFAVWWGERNFWVYDGSVQVLRCDVIDWLYDDLDPNQVSKICAFSVTDFSEIWWLYQSTSTTTTEVDSYVVWNYKDNTWYQGRINRTAGADKGVLFYPVMVNRDGAIFNHELDDVLPNNEGDIFVETGAIRIGNGEKNVAVRFIYPDTENANDVTFTLTGRQFPTDTEYTYGPYTMYNPTPTTGARGRSIKFRADFISADGELGICQLDVAPINTGGR